MSRRRIGMRMMARFLALQLSGSRAAAIAAILLLAVPGPLAAAESPWVKGEHARLRLIAERGADGTIAAGLEMRLDAGWKTYWRYPGDAGIPPRFDFSGSKNVRDVAVSWPAPHRFGSADSGISIGYAGQIVFPLAVRQTDPGAATNLVLAFDFAVCGNLCIPVTAALQLALPARAGAASASSEATRLLEQFRLRVPRALALGESGPLAIAALAVDRARQPWRVAVEAVAPPDAELFVEGPTAAWALPVPGPGTPRPDGRLRFEFDLDGAPPDAALDDARLTFTLVTATAATETTTALPAAP